MGCCGEPVDKPLPEESNRITPFDSGKPVNQQPSPQSTLQWQEKPLQQPGLTTPPPVLQYGQPAWNHQQQPGQFNPYANGPPSSPTAVSTNFTGSANGYVPTTGSPPPGAYRPIAAPSAVYAGNGGMSVSGRRTTSPTTQNQFAAPSDEGKLSVSIDFGECDVR